jgi:hypothetical protein
MHEHVHSALQDPKHNIYNYNVYKDSPKSAGRSALHEVAGNIVGLYEGDTVGRVKRIPLTPHLHSAVHSTVEERTVNCWQMPYLELSVNAEADHAKSL